MNRRKFIGTSAALVTGGGLLGYTTLVEPHWLDITQHDLPVANLPSALEGMTLAQISDLHSCSYVDEAYLIESLTRVKALRPDIVVLTGDFITWELDRKPADKIAQLERVLSHFPHGRLATLAILGNHDYGYNWTDGAVADIVVSLAGRAGIGMLRNEAANIHGLDIVGVDDLWSGRADSTKALGLRTGTASIALCHNPDAMDELSWAGYSGWILAGHTHGGQCKPPFLPPPILPVKNRRYTSGEILVDSERTLYISKGVGHLFRVRLNVRPEIPIFTLRSARTGAG